MNLILVQINDFYFKTLFIFSYNYNTTQMGSHFTLSNYYIVETDKYIVSSMKEDESESSHASSTIY